MLSIHDPATRQQVLRLDLEPTLRRHIEGHLNRAEASGLLDHTHVLVIESDDTELDIIRELGWSPLLNPLSEARFGTRGFEPYWTHLIDLGGWFELLHPIGDSGFAAILLIEDRESACPELQGMCQHFVGGGA